MYIRLGDITWLTNPNDGTSERLVTSSRGLKINGKLIVQEGDFMRAAAASFFARGNLANTISFKVTRRFTTIATAFAFAAQHGSSLSQSGELLLVSGWPSETQQQSRSANAVLVQCDYDSDDTPGVSVTHGYTLRCGPITAVPAVGAPLQFSTGDPIKFSTGDSIQL